MGSDEHGGELLEGLAKKGFVKAFDKHEDVVKYLGKHPVISKLALITTTKDGVTKYRLVLDCRVSGSNSRTRKSERILHPRAWDVIPDVLGLSTLMQDGDDLEFLVCDVSDAFYMLPLHFDEQHYYCASYKGRFYIWTRVVQGSLNGPEHVRTLVSTSRSHQSGMLRPTRTSTTDLQRRPVRCGQRIV